MLDFFGKTKPKLAKKLSIAHRDNVLCGEGMEYLDKNKPFIHSVITTTDGKRTTTYSRTNVPLIGVITNCMGRPATDIEREQHASENQNNR